MNTILIVTIIATNAMWAISYERLRRKHTETIGALWASMIERR